ncbi:iron-sulfur cluster assembly accessory protein [Bartonella doshiae]|uniref:Iron-sulfur cluster assembly protein n=2 Tax=Bartonella doshiae TaxID=33044 RepID=A0A380ZFD2_BARDO|nr:iron-sulfur cluster assembly accessory protein [Bartonella doshiae]EJF80908.1 iron-sulfur cluster assembly accessory protein [Bartonella doshiae NCTC 12862 = ATCC 700133]MBB6159454.1 iron-sulfur cluster assembly protein [Bartonella doshiae]SUV45044.1 Iron-sulfur cluster assembly protein [Bartonella doshiae]
MSRFSVINLTEAAVDRVKAIMNAKDACGILIGIKKGGCAGMEYTITLVKEEMPNADVVEVNGARVFIAHDAVLFLLGTQVDYEVTTLRSGFVFKNPNQVSACGCGESVELRPALQNQLDEIHKAN